MKAEAKPLVEARNLVKSYPAREGFFLRRPRAVVPAVRGVDLVVHEAETVALVGESGSGKSTLGRLLVRLLDPDQGDIRFDGVDLLSLRGRALRRMRRHFQIVFQDPASALNPRMRVGSIVAEPLAIHRIGSSRAERRERAAKLLEEVGLDRSALDKYPHEFSGGQRQRIGIARAIACGPRFLVADEPVSALDPPVQAQIVNLLVELQERHGIAYLLIAHDLRLVEHAADRVAVLYLGKIVEEAPAAELFREPLHPYTELLLASTPSLTPGRRPEPPVSGELPSPSSIPPGCPFHPRCPRAIADCSRIEPRLLPAGPGRRAACHLVHPAGGSSGGLS